jgi:hypothetical protein
MRFPYVFLLSGLGLFLPACGGSSGEGIGSGSAALDDDPDLTAYFASKEFSALTGDVALEVRQVLTAAGPTSRTTMLALFRSPKWLMLGSASDPVSCPESGSDAQISLLDWIKANETPQGAESPANVDARTAANVASLKRLLALQDVRHIGPTLASIQSGLAGSQPAYAQPSSCKSGGGSTTKSGGGGAGGGSTTKSGGGGASGGSTTNGGNAGCVDTTTKSCSSGSSTTNAGSGGSSNNKTRASLDPAGVKVKAAAKPEAQRILDGMLASSAGPTPALAREWSALRASYQAKLAKVAASPLARDLVAQARRAGSATLAREGARTAMKFDRGAALVDRMVQRDVGFSAEAMRLVHSAVADRDHGRLRKAGQDVQCGDDAAQAYLPGAMVEGAVAALFADVAEEAPRLAAPQLAAAFDQHLISIHPFEDANGRTARLMTDWLLLRAGFPPVAGKEAQITALFWQKQGRSLDRDAHLARITAGMQRTVDLLERV